MGHGGGDRPDAGETPGGRGDLGDPGRGRSESSPGHLKKAAGAQSARDYAPGRIGRGGANAVLPEVAPDEMAED
jgi:hypothetical protein